ncbi:MAG: mannose-1-phosphate guanylyltransferase [Bradymonadia bacterium]|jgi:mannose-1-phosphate guanylyltransferase
MYVVIMAGGVGARFWPMSRAHRPKQLLPLFSDKPMIAETVQRFLGWVPAENILVVTSASLVDAIAECVPELPRENLIAEPMGRNTAPCIALALAAIEARSGGADSVDEVVSVFPADHFIANQAAFEATVQAAADNAEPGAIVTIGITPTSPATGYGYIQTGEQMASGGMAVKRFVEKPDRETALGYLQSGEYVWNAGMFVFRASAMRGELKRQLPAMEQAIAPLCAALKSNDADALSSTFGALDRVSIDYGVMEGASDVRVVPATFGWSDVGHWDALPEVSEQDADGNVIQGDVVALSCKNSVMLSTGGRVVAGVGLENMVVVDTEDAVLVAPRHRVQEVRGIVDALKPRGGRLT